VGLSGSKSVTPMTTTTYTLTTMGELGAPSKSLTVNVAGGGGDGGDGGGGGGGGGDTIICTPGALKCIGPDLYVCNTAGTAWTLKTANSPTCAAGGSTPDFWTDPVGWVIGTITKSWEAMLGFVTGQFNIFLANLKNFQDNFSLQLAAFIADPLKSLRKWLDGVYAGISAIAGEVTKGITSWWDSTSASVMSWIDTASASVTTWVNDQIGILKRGWDTTFATIPGLITNATADFSAWIDTGFKNIGAWWTSTAASVTSWIQTATNNLTTWINGVVKGINDAWTTATTAISKAWNDAVTGLSAYVNTQFNALKTTVEGIPGAVQGLIDTAVSGMKDWVLGVIPDLVSAMFEWAKPIIKPIQDAVGWLGQIAGVFNNTYPKDPEIISIQEKQKKAQELLQKLYARK